MAKKIIMPDELGVQYVAHMGTDMTPVNAARISLASESINFDQKDKDLIRYLAKNNHMTPFEHQQVCFIITCPLFIRSQIHRHRTFSYNEVSRRYTDDGINFLKVEKFHYQDKKNKQGSAEELDADTLCKAKQLVEYTQLKCQEIYEKLLDMGVSKEEARVVLPVGLMTKFYMTGNLRNWMQFLALRLDPHAQWQTRIIAKMIFDQLVSMFPISVGALAAVMLTPGGYEYATGFKSPEANTKTVLDNPDAGTQTVMQVGKAEPIKVVDKHTSSDTFGSDGSSPNIT